MPATPSLCTQFKLVLPLKDYVLHPPAFGTQFVTPILKGSAELGQQKPLLSQSKKVQGMEKHREAEVKIQLNLQTAVSDYSTTAQV